MTAPGTGREPAGRLPWELAAPDVEPSEAEPVVELYIGPERPSSTVPAAHGNARGGPVPGQAPTVGSAADLAAGAAPGADAAGRTVYTLNDVVRQFGDAVDPYSDRIEVLNRVEYPPLYIQLAIYAYMVLVAFSLMFAWYCVYGWLLGQKYTVTDLEIQAFRYLAVFLALLPGVAGLSYLARWRAKRANRSRYRIMLEEARHTGRGIAAASLASPGVTTT